MLHRRAASPRRIVVQVLAGDTAVGDTISIGVAAADLALYRAKHTARDRVSLYDPADAAPDTSH